MHILFYIISLWFYRVGIGLVSPWNRRARSWIRGRKDWPRGLAGFSAESGAGRVWVHCASIGQFEKAAPLIEGLKRAYPGVRILLSFYSPRGYEQKKGDPLADQVVYLPMDSRKNARAFLDSVRPQLVLWMEQEYWYFHLRELRERNIPTLLVSATIEPGQLFFKWYGRLHRYMLNSFTWIFVQSESSLDGLERLGLSARASFSGDTRVDRVIERAEREDPVDLIERFCGNGPVIVAGSTWEEDAEELGHYANIHPEIRFLVAPYHLDAEDLAVTESLFHRSVRYSVLPAVQATVPAGAGPGNREPNVLLIDSMGMLSSLYRYASICYVGGGFGDQGVHNVLEAAVFGKPVVFGPVIEPSIEAMELEECGGGIVIDSALEAESVFDRLLGNPEEYRQRAKAAGNYVQEKKGATQRILNYIQENRLLTS
jgi:3-deoxy-D-manno-octulosonic-acid transferase